MGTRQTKVDDKMYKLLAVASKNLSKKMNVKITMVDASRLLANQLEQTEVKISPPKRKKRDWVFEYEMTPLRFKF